MKKINSKGFTLIELLAVITIMGILMLVAIPAVSRTIENSRRDTYMDTAKAYLNAVKNAVAGDEIKCQKTAGQDNTLAVISAVPSGDYYLGFFSGDNTGTDLLEQGGKSSWGNSEVKGRIKIHKDVDADRGTTKYEYSIKMIDEAGRGIENDTLESALNRSTVKTAGLTGYDTANTASGEKVCQFFVG